MDGGKSRREETARYKIQEGGLIQVLVPMAPPLLLMNGYLLRDEDGGITVVDPGPRSREAEAVWEDRELGASWNAVKQIVVTHHHPDHYGLAGWLQERSGCSLDVEAGACRGGDDVGACVRHGVGAAGVFCPARHAGAAGGGAEGASGRDMACDFAAAGSFTCGDGAVFCHGRPGVAAG
ncbi:MBL fold metallo-hydrolase [Paenibacillus sp. URB8-2]|uniref:MBL fold metallo-hydrolase n=1 Tax=Paenibacillus sp. URB8-2 TaxID=2741301 RepID=UPI0015C1F172|nr:hypothetical protein PUR_40190 [Paenibacillus sp. URB8-2]